MAEKWIDFSGARPGAAAIKKAGAEGVLRYVSANIASTKWKRATKAEIAEYRKVGLDVILNFEWYEGRMLEGAPAGKADGKTALAQAKAIGYPKGASIYFSHDTAARNDKAVLAYMRAAQAALGSYYKADIYSGYDTVQMCLKNKVALHGWQTIAWSGGKIGDAHLYQNGKQWFGNGADENLVRNRPLGSWQNTLDGVKKQPAPAPVVPMPPNTPAPASVPGPGMIVVTVDRDDPDLKASGKGWPGTFVFNGSTLSHIVGHTANVSNVANLEALLGKAVTISYKQYLEWNK